MHAIGYEHEGFAIQGTTWYTDKMYQASAALTRYLAARYHIALDRAHIIGHDDVPGPTTGFVAGMHWDPGPFWDWARYMELLGAPIRSTARGGNIVTIAPNFERNQPQVRECQGNGSLQPPQPANFVYLRTAPSFEAPLFNDPGLATGGTDCANDWGDKAVTGQDFYRVDRQGDWDAIWYAGSKVWFYDPSSHDVVGTAGTVITPKAGATSIAVYGRAYPESISTATMTQYSIAAGHAVDRYCGERHGIAVVGPAADQSDAIGRIVEDDRLELRRLEVHVRAGVLCVEIVFVEVLAMILVHREARLALAGRVDVAVSIGFVARRWRPVLNRGLEVVAAHAVDLERNSVRFGGRVVLGSFQERRRQRVSTDLFE